MGNYCLKFLTYNKNILLPMNFTKFVKMNHSLKKINLGEYFSNYTNVLENLKSFDCLTGNVKFILQKKFGIFYNFKQNKYNNKKYQYIYYIGYNNVYCISTKINYL